MERMIHLPTSTTSKKIAQKRAPQAKNDEKTRGIIAVDNGGYNTKILSESMTRPVAISSRKAYGHNRFKFQTAYPEGTYKIYWEGKWYFMGMLLLESRNQLTGYTHTKSTDYFILSILQAIALYGFDINKVVTSTPISRYSEEEIETITNRLIGTHELEINGKNYSFEIEDVIVAPETSTAFFALMPEGKVRWLDLGSRTVGYATTVNENGFFMPIEMESGTIEKEGLDIRTDITDFSEYVENLSAELNRVWDAEDYIIAFGGGAEIPELVDELKSRYPNLHVAEEPLFLLVKGMFELGIQTFNGDDVDEN
jgi:Actin like proteins N terminal domain